MDTEHHSGDPPFFPDIDLPYDLQRLVWLLLNLIFRMWPSLMPAPVTLPSTTEVPQAPRRRQAARQLLSCTKCRERKVKCDRCKPCSACCARGQPKECVFLVEEGSDYSPIQQSYELRKLRIQVQRLQECLLAANIEFPDLDDDDSAISAWSKNAATRQRRYKNCDKAENLYFGTPGLANVIADFANLAVGSHSLTHTVPRARDIYRVEASMYPFPVLPAFGSDAITLLQVLPKKAQLYSYVDMFHRRANATCYPHMPADSVSKVEIERFLSNPEKNATSYPDMLALIFAMLATGSQVGVWDVHSKWVEGEVSKSLAAGDIYIAASMQALRLASHGNQPTLLGIETLMLMGPYLTNSGRFLDAWTLFGTTIRIAHSMGLHRDPKFIEPTPPQRESNTRRTLWWWMLHMDQQYSVTLGRPLGISGIGDCPLPDPLNTEANTMRLGEFVDHFTVLARQILGSDAMLSISKIDEFTDKLMGLWDTMPESLQFNESWSRPETELPDWPLATMSASLFAKVQSFIILLNRQRQERTIHYKSLVSTEPPPTYYSPGQQLLHPAPIRGRALVINSSVQLLQTFLFFHHREPAVLICWTLGQQAFNACMILILDAWETHNDQNEWLVDQAYAVFAKLAQCGVHSLASMAVRRISDGLAQLAARKQDAEGAAGSSYQPSLDTSSMADFTGDHVMGQTGMYLLEDNGLQSHQQTSFRPLAFFVGDSVASSASQSPAPSIPVSNVPVAPFPVMAPSYLPSEPTIPISTAPFAVNPPAPSRAGRSAASNGRPRPATRLNTSTFPAINGTIINDVAQLSPQDQQCVAQHVAAAQQSHNGRGHPGRSQWRVQRPPRTQARGRR